MAFKATNLAEFNDWKSSLRQTLTHVLGGFPDRETPLNPILLDAHSEDGYFLEKVSFESEPGVRVPCYILIPDSVSPPYRPVIALHGHGTGGAAYLLGKPLDPDNVDELDKIAREQHDYARQLALHGFMVFAPVQRGLGERIEVGRTQWSGAGLSSCRAMSFNALLMGKTLLGFRIWDVIRTIDYIRSRPEPMVAGLGCLGHSGGGTTTLFSAALDDRISAAVVSGYFNSFRSSIMAMNHCECNYVPGIAKYVEMVDIAGLIAPRPLLVVNGKRDGIFPIHATLAAYQDLEKIYTFLGKPEALDKDIFDDDHRFNGPKAFDWLKRWLQ